MVESKGPILAAEKPGTVTVHSLPQDPGREVEFMRRAANQKATKILKPYGPPHS